MVVPSRSVLLTRFFTTWTAVHSDTISIHLIHLNCYLLFKTYIHIVRFFPFNPFRIKQVPRLSDRVRVAALLKQTCAA